MTEASSRPRRASAGMAGQRLAQQQRDDAIEAALEAASARAEQRALQAEQRRAAAEKNEARARKKKVDEEAKKQRREAERQLAQEQREAEFLQKEQRRKEKEKLRRERAQEQEEARAAIEGAARDALLPTSAHAPGITSSPERLLVVLKQAACPAPSPLPPGCSFVP